MLFFQVQTIENVLRMYTCLVECLGIAGSFSKSIAICHSYTLRRLMSDNWKSNDPVLWNHFVDMPFPSVFFLVKIYIKRNA